MAHHDEFNAFGPAVNDAYMLESKKAKSPRIILSSHTLSKGIEASPEHQNKFDISLLKSLIKQDKDVYTVALRDDTERLIGYYEKHEYRDPGTMKLYDFDK